MSKTLQEIWASLRRKVPGLEGVEDPILLSAEHRIDALMALGVRLGREVNRDELRGLATSGYEFGVALRTYDIELRGDTLPNGDQPPSGRYKNLTTGQEISI